MKPVWWVAGLLLVGCSYSTKVLVKTSDPAVIEVDGFAVCETTPCEIELRCKDELFPDSQRRIVTATPKKKGQFLQTKSVPPCGIPQGSRSIYFEMGLQPAPTRTETDVRIDSTRP